MQVVPAITRYTCALACLESFSRDAGLFYTQADLLKYHPLKCLNPARSHEFGAMTPPQLQDMCQALDLAPQVSANPGWAAFSALAANLESFQGILLVNGNYNNSGNGHTVRFHSIVAGQQRVKVMCPYFGVARLEEVDWQVLVGGNVTVIKITKQAH